MGNHRITMARRSLVLLPLAALLAVALWAPQVETDMAEASAGRRLLAAPSSALRRLLQYLQTSGSYTMSVDDNGMISTSGSFTMGYGGGEDASEEEGVEQSDSIGEEEAETAGCKTDSDCHADGDMGGYCKENGDCHCTSPFFATNGQTCKLSCSPTSKTPCCRGDADCQKGGDKAAYCKSPRSNEHTVPGNGMCRCDAGYSGTTGCKKSPSPFMAAMQRLNNFDATLSSAWAFYACPLFVVASLFFITIMRRRRAQFATQRLEMQYKNVLQTSEDQI